MLGYEYQFKMHKGEQTRQTIRSTEFGSYYMLASTKMLTFKNSDPNKRPQGTITGMQIRNNHGYVPITIVEGSTWIRKVKRTSTRRSYPLKRPSRTV